MRLNTFKATKKDIFNHVTTTGGQLVNGMIWAIISKLFIESRLIAVVQSYLMIARLLYLILTVQGEVFKKKIFFFQVYPPT